MDHPPLYGIGYSGRTLDEIKRIVEQLNACLVDIRFAPYSRNPDFRKDALRGAFGSRYLYLPQLGNRNYKSGGAIALADYEAGKRALAALDRPALLLCACSNPVTCHRAVVLERLAQDGFLAHEWNPGGAEQLALW